MFALFQGQSEGNVCVFEMFSVLQPVASDPGSVLISPAESRLLSPQGPEEGY